MHLNCSVSISLRTALTLIRQVEVMQQLLQSQSTSFRLTGLKRILAEAVEELNAVMMDDGVMPDDLLNQVKRASYSRDDDDDDLMPPPEYHGVTIESELDDDLVAELCISEQDLADVKSGLCNKAIDTIIADPKSEGDDTILSSSPGSNEGEIDIWEAGGDAFQ